MLKKVEDSFSTDYIGVTVPYPIWSSYSMLVEYSIYLNVHHVDIRVLKDGLYHPTVAGFDFHHKIVAKD